MSEENRIEGKHFTEISAIVNSIIKDVDAMADACEKNGIKFYVKSLGDFGTEIKFVSQSVVAVFQLMKEKES